MGRHQLTEFGDQRAVPPEGGVGLVAVLDGAGPQFLQACDPGGSERGVADVAQRGAAPQGQRLPQQPGGRRRFTAEQGLAALGAEPLEAVRVDLVGGDDQPLARRVPLDRTGSTWRSRATWDCTDCTALPAPAGRCSP